MSAIQKCVIFLLDYMSTAWFAIQGRKCRWKKVVLVVVHVCERVLVCVCVCVISVPVLKLHDWTLVVESDHLHYVSQPVPEVGLYS